MKKLKNIVDMDIIRKLERVLILNTKPNKNNRVYNLPILELACQQINSRDKYENLGMLGICEDVVITLGRVAFFYENARVEDECLYVDIEIFSSNTGQELNQILDIEEEIQESRIVFRPNGFGSYVNGSAEQMMDMLNVPKTIADDYQIISISAIPANEDSLIK
jgi:hypothetical protein